MIKVTLEGKTYKVDDNKLKLSEAYVLKAFARMTPKGWQDGLAEADPHALAFLVWLAKTRSGEALDIASIEFDYEDFSGEQVEEPPDPTEAETSATATGTTEKTSGTAAAST